MLDYVSLTELYTGLGFLSNISNQGPRREFTRRFHVLLNQFTDDIDFVLACPNLPVRLQAHPRVKGAWVNDLRGRPHEDNGCLWVVDVNYVNRFDLSSDEEGTEDNPLNRPPHVSGSFQQFQRPVWLDKDGLPIRNSASDFFDPPIEIDDSRPIVRVTKNYALSAFSYPAMLLYRDAINIDSFMGFPPLTLKCVIEGFDVKKEQAKEGETETQYVEASFQFHYNPEKWLVRMLDAGFRELNYNGSTYELTPIILKNGLEPSKPWPLINGNKAVPPDDLPTILEFHVYKELPFSGLGIF